MYVVPLGRHFKPHYPVFIGRFTTPCRFVGRPFRATITLRPFGRLSTPCRPEDRPTNRLTKPTIFVGLKTDLQGNDFVGRPFRATITLDRKSTRLNSSHVRISYAVFCLKKKNKKTL